MSAPVREGTAAGQAWDPCGYQANAGFVPILGAAVLDLLAPLPGEHILDVGCGDGVLTEKIAAAGASVVGFDASEELVAAARARGIDVVLGDAHALPFSAEFDAVFSNAALHWMREPDAVLDGIRRALKPGGRFVAEFGGFGNIAAIVTALIAALEKQGLDGKARFPWFYPTPAEYSARLDRHGFRVDSIALVPRPTPLPTGMRGWLETFANPFFVGMSEDARKEATECVLALLERSLRDTAGNWTADYVRIRVKATLLAK
jgi:SAM-dependent methyltransferase